MRFSARGLGRTNIGAIDSVAVVKHMKMSKINPIILCENDVPGASFGTNDIEECSNEQLKRWLGCRGLKKTGNRRELIQRLVDFS